jgi:hypothetical protein
MKKIILFLLLSLLISCKNQSSDIKDVNSSDTIQIVDKSIDKRQRLKDVYTSQIGIREVGSNRGKDVFRYQNAAGIKSGMPWCGSFVWFCYKEAGLNPNIKGPARAANWFTNKDKIIIIRGEIKKRKAQSGDVIGVSYSNGINHVGFYDTESDKFYLTVEGNTGGKKSDPGEGVYRLKRVKRQVLYIANHID